MRLLTIRTSKWRYGAENHVMRVACGAARRGVEVHAAFPSVDGTASMVRDCEVAGVYHRPFDWIPSRKGVPKAPLRAALFQVPWFIQMRHLLKAVRPDVVHLTPGLWRELWVVSLSCAVFNIPALVVFQGTGNAETAKRHRPAQVTALAWARRRRQRWMAVSRNNLATLQSKFKARADEIGILPNGIEIDAAPSREESKTLRCKVRHELGLPASAKLLLTTARLSAGKGHADLLSIASKVVHSFPEIFFIWVGDGRDRGSFEQQVREQGLQRHVRFLGYRTDIDRLVRASDLLVFPSHSEGGCSSAIREAMVNHLPIVCSDAGGIPEVVTDGIHGLVFPARDTDALCARLSEALADPDKMRALAAQARKRIEEFSADRMVENYLAVFRELCRDGKRSRAMPASCQAT